MSGWDVARAMAVDVVTRGVYWSVFAAWQDALLAAYEALVLRETTPPGSWRRHNVILSWDPRPEVWAWPPIGDLAPYNAAKNGGSKVRVLGSCYGMSEVCHPMQGGRALLAGAGAQPGSGRVERIGPTTVRCHLGATFDDVHACLAGSGQALANQPGFSGLSVAGVIGTGGHGSGLRSSPLASMVRRIQLEDATYCPEDREFGAALTHLGRLGPVLSIDLEVVPAFNIAEQRRVRRLGAAGRTWREDLRALIDEAIALQQDPSFHSAELWIAPYPDWDGVLTVVLGVRRETQEPITRDGARPPELRSRSIQALGEVAASYVALGFASRDTVGGMLRASLGKVAMQRPVIMSAREGLDFGAANRMHVRSIEAAMELARGADAVIGAIDAVDALADEDLYVFAPMGVRFSGKLERASGLSPYAGRGATLHLEIPTFWNERIFHTDEVLKALQQTLARDHQGRPHWGQCLFLDAAELKALWSEADLDAFRALRDARDRAGTFQSARIDALLA